jgi:predicted Zn-dependent protease with MMP-like domain
MTEKASIEDRWEKVRSLLDEGRLDEALGEAEHLRNDLPDSADVLALVGVVQAQRGEVEEALLSFDEALAVEPDFKEAKLEKSQLLLDEERYEDVLTTLASEDSPDALPLLALALYQLGEHEEADTVLKKALAAEDRPELRHLEALLHLQRGEREEALVSVARALELEPELAEGYHARGLALTQLGRLEEADAAFARAAELDPESYIRPHRLTAELFDDVVDEALEDLPEEFQQYLENVEVSVLEVPEPEVIREGIEFDLLGLYQGATIQSDSWDLPDRVILFQRNIENVSPDRETLVEEIRDTVFHEVAHHMGMDEDEVRSAEEGEAES